MKNLSKQWEADFGLHILKEETLAISELSLGKNSKI